MTSNSKPRYGDLPSDQRKALEQLAAKIRNRAKTTTNAILEIGAALIEAKRQVAHGVFAKWVAVDCGFSMRTAQNYMRAARFLADKGETVALLAPATIYRLSAKNTAPEIVASVLKRVETGLVPTECEVAALFAKAKSSQKPQPGTGRIAVRNAPEATATDGARERAAALATELLDQLGAELARRVTESDWKLVVECLCEQLEESSPADVAITPSASAGVSLVRDPTDSSLFRPRVLSIVPEVVVAAQEAAPVHYCPINHSDEDAIPIVLCRSGLPHSSS